MNAGIGEDFAQGGEGDVAAKELGLALAWVREAGGDRARRPIHVDAGGQGAVGRGREGHYTALGVVVRLAEPGLEGQPPHCREVQRHDDDAGRAYPLPAYVSGKGIISEWQISFI